MIDLTALAFQNGENICSDAENMQKGVDTSPGGSDEFVSIFLYHKRIPWEELDES